MSKHTLSVLEDELRKEREFQDSHREQLEHHVTMAEYSRKRLKEISGHIDDLLEAINALEAKEPADGSA